MEIAVEKRWNRKKIKRERKGINVKDKKHQAGKLDT